KLRSNLYAALKHWGIPPRYFDSRTGVNDTLVEIGAAGHDCPLRIAACACAALIPMATPDMVGAISVGVLGYLDGIDGAPSEDKEQLRRLADLKQIADGQGNEDAYYALFKAWHR